MVTKLVNPLLGNVFCPTGTGGGIDPSCGSSGKSNKVSSVRDMEAHFRSKFPELKKLNLAEGEDYVRLGDIEVAKEGRGKGVGGEVVEALKEYARDKNKPVILTAQPESGKKAKLYRFYKDHGFKIPGNKKNFALPRHTHTWSPE